MTNPVAPPFRAALSRPVDGVAPPFRAACAGLKPGATSVATRLRDYFPTLGKPA
jgi:hypothetical protein